MVIKIKPKFTKEQIEKLLSDKLDKLSSAIISRFLYIGEQFVKDARENGTYTDRTGNLRNSVGYLILVNGSVIYENFKRSANVSGEGEKVSKGDKSGVEAGRSTAKKASQRFPKGIVLIVVAGMDYAAAVESKGRDVLTASSVGAKRSLTESIGRLALKMERM